MANDYTSKETLEALAKLAQSWEIAANIQAMGARQAIAANLGNKPYVQATAVEMARADGEAKAFRRIVGICVETIAHQEKA